MIKDNVRRNYVDIAVNNPNTTFYVFFPPYSVCQWDIYHQTGEIDYILDAERTAIEELLGASNIRIFSWSDDFNLTENLELYKDFQHYGDEVNSKILTWLSEGHGELTKSNYLNYIQLLSDYYHTYDYESLHMKKAEYENGGA